MERVVYADRSMSHKCLFPNRMKKNETILFWVYEKLITLQGPNQLLLDEGSRHTRLRLTCQSLSGANRASVDQGRQTRDQRNTKIRNERSGT